MNRENFFIALELDHQVTDPSAITAQIEKKRAEWMKQRSQGSLVQKGRAKSYLEQLEQMSNVLLDRNARSNEAREAKKIRSKASHDATQAVTDALRIIGKASIDKSTAEQLEKLFAHQVQELDVEKIIKRQRVAIAPEIGQGPSTQTTSFKRLAVGDEQRLFSELGALGLSSLYELLSEDLENPLDANSELNRLESEARQLGEKLRKARATAENKIRQSLAGQAREVFRSAEEKERYDSSAALRRMIELEGFAKLFKSAGFLESQQYQELIKTGVQRSGKSPDLVKAFFDDVLARLKIRVLSGESIDLQIFVCPYCSELNAPESKACQSCKEPFEGPCFNCGAKFSVELDSCPKCQVLVSDGVLARPLLSQARASLATSAIADCRRLIQQAAGLAPENHELGKLIEALEARSQQLARARQTIEAALSENRYFTADKLLQQHLEDLEPDAARRYRDIIRKQIEASQAAEASGRAALQGGDTILAVERFKVALNTARDNEGAQNALARIPPDPPQKASAQQEAETVAVSWKPPANRDGLEYVVVRREGAAPRGADDGDIVATTRGLSCRDETVAAGKVHHYAVFSQRGRATSVTAAHSGEVLRTAPVVMRQVSSTADSIALSWRLPSGAVGAYVYKFKDSGREIDLSGRQPVAVAVDSWTDTEVDPGERYVYPIVARFEPASAKRQWRSAAIQVPAAATPSPSEVRGLRFDDEDGSPRFRWTPSSVKGERDELCLYREAPKADSAVTYSDADYPPPVMAQKVHSAGVATAPQEVFGVFTIHVIRWRGPLCRFSAPVTYSRLAPVTGLRMERVGDGIGLNWRWPKGCRHAQVSVRATDPGAAAEMRLERASKTEGNRYDHVLQVEGGHIYQIAVQAATEDYAHVSDPRSGEFEHLVSDTIRFDIKMDRPFLGQHQTKLILEPRKTDRIPALVVCLSPHKIPLAPNQGEVLLTIRAQEAPNRRLEIDLTDKLDDRRGFINVLPKEKEARDRIRLLPASKLALEL